MVTHHAEIVFSTVPGYRPLTLDLYVGDAPRALCVYLHGGGWRVGSRHQGPGPVGPDSRRFFDRMAERGLAVASIDYRLSGEAVYPAQLDDVVAACLFVTDSGDAFGVHGLPLVLWGVSAGAHLAGLCALATDVGDTIVAVSSWSAPSDLSALADDIEAIGGVGERDMDARESQLLGSPVGRSVDLARAASPIAHARATRTAFQLVHGTADTDIPIVQTQRYARALAEAGAPVATVTVDGANHFYATIPAARLIDLVDGSIDFLLDHAAD